MDFLAIVIISIALLIGSALPSSSSVTESSTSGAGQSSVISLIFSVLNEVTIFALGFLGVAFSMYKKKVNKIAKRISAARLPTACGSFVVHCYKAMSDEIEHAAIVKGEIGNGEGVLVRVHSECLTGDIFKSARCDCGNQLELALKKIEEAGRGVVVYLRGHEGRGIGLGQKLRAYNLQDDGRDTVQANEDLGLPVDSRDYSIGAQILKDLGVKTIKLMTNNPDKCIKLKGCGLEVTQRVPILAPVTKDNKQYLETKEAKMGHLYGSATNDPLY